MKTFSAKNCLVFGPGYGAIANQYICFLAYKMFPRKYTPDLGLRSPGLRSLVLKSSRLKRPGLNSPGLESSLLKSPKLKGLEFDARSYLVTPHDLVTVFDKPHESLNRDCTVFFSLDLL